MVGRMNGQSVVLEARKGKVSVALNEKEDSANQVVYDYQKEVENDQIIREEKATSQEEGVHQSAETNSNPFPMGGADQCDSDLQRDASGQRNSREVARPGDEGYVRSIGTTEQERESTSTNASFRETSEQVQYQEPRGDFSVNQRGHYGPETHESPTAFRNNNESTQWSDNSGRSIEGTGDFSPDVLQDGEQIFGDGFSCFDGSRSWATGEDDRYAERAPEEPGEQPSKTGDVFRAKPHDPRFDRRRREDRD
jgi:hypothetical protein